MEATVIRGRPLSALIIGATGANVLRVVTAFEARRIMTLRADDIATACDRIAVDMPHVVLALVPTSAAEREALADRALAVGALVVHLDPQLDNEGFKQVLDRTVLAALQRKALREAAEVGLAGNNAETLSPDDVDEGWEG